MTDPESQAIEQVARALYEQFAPPDPWWEGEDVGVWNHWRERASVALADQALPPETRAAVCGFERHGTISDNGYAGPPVGSELAVYVASPQPEPTAPVSVPVPTEEG